MSKLNRSLENRLRELEDEDELLAVSKIAEEKLVGHEDDFDRHEVVHIAELHEEIEEAYQQWGKHQGIPCGYKLLDQQMKGMDNGEVIVIAGKTSNGKSALGLNIARNVAKMPDKGVLFVTLEMTAAQVGSRLRWINGGPIDNLNIIFQKTRTMDYRDFEPTIKRGKEMMEDQMSLIVLDYLQYLGRGMTLEETSKMSKEIKRLALEYNTPIIVISQMRKTGKGDDKNWSSLTEDDLMGTSSIAYDADQIMIASRKDPDNEYKPDEFWVKYLKNRNRGFDVDNQLLRMRWNKTRIEDYDNAAEINKIFGIKD